MTAFRSPVNAARLQDLTDVSVTGATDGQVLAKNGASWLPSSVVSDSELGVRVAAPTGVAATDTANINSAATTAIAAGRQLVFRAGNYAYNGTGLSGYTLDIRGQGINQTTITLSTGVSFINHAAGMTSLSVCGITFSGGGNVIRLTNTGVSVVGLLVIRECEFLGYTGAAISNEAADQPYWMIDRCRFQGANYTTAIGIALSGDSSGSIISRCDFEKNRIHIKLRGLSGQDVRVSQCSFLRFGAGTLRTDIWIVPTAPSTFYEGAGFICDANKFGSENMDNSDFRVLYADEGAGADITTKLPSTGASTGLVNGHQFANNWLSGAPDFIVSYTPDVRSLVVRDLTTMGTVPAYILRYVTTPTNEGVGGALTNEIGPIHNYAVGIVTATGAPRATNAPGAARVIDPLHQYTDANEHAPYGFGDLADYSALFVGAASTLSVTGGTTAADTDALGGPDAVEANFTATSGSLYTTVAPTVGVPAWIDVDLKTGSTSPLTYARVGFAQNGVFTWSRLVKIPATWKRFRFPVTNRATMNQLVISGDSILGRVLVGRVRCYHAREPVNVVEAFTAPTLTNSWANFGSGFEPPGYYRDPHGRVHLKGVIASGTIGQAAFTLPAGYRPPLNVTFPTISNDAIGRATVNSTGTVIPTVGSNTWFSLDGISFRAT